MRHVKLVLSGQPSPEERTATLWAAVLALSNAPYFRVYVISIDLVPSLNISKTYLSGLITRNTVLIGMSFRPVAGQFDLPSSVMTLLPFSPLPSLVNVEVCMSLTQTVLNVCLMLS